MLRAKQRDEYIKIVKQYKTGKVFSMQNKAAYKMAWLDLAYNHFITIRRQLDCIKDIKSKDQNEAKRDNPILLTDYLRHYKLDYLLSLKEYIEQAQAGIEYLASKIDAELARRKAEQP